MKLLSLILTTFAIIAPVQGCYYMITSLTVMPLHNLRHYYNAAPEAKPIYGKLEEIYQGTIKMTLETGEVYKPYLYYEMECKKIGFGMKSSKKHCVLTFLSFEQSYEKIRMEIQVDKSINKACGESHLLDLLSTKRLCYVNETNDKIGLRVEDEGADLDFSFDMESSQYVEIKSFPKSIRVIKNHVEQKHEEEKKNEKVKRERKEKKKHGVLINKDSHYNAFSGDHRTIRNIPEEQSYEFEVYNYDNFLAVNKSKNKHTYHLSANHCVLKLINFAIAEHMCSCEDKIFGFYSYENSADFEQIKPIKLLQRGTITDIQHQSLLEAIVGQKPKVVEFLYASLEEEAAASGTRVTLRVEDEEQKLIKKYFFEFNNKNKHCIDQLKLQIYANVPCGGEALIVKNIIKKPLSNNNITIYSPNFDQEYLIKKEGDEIIMSTIKQAQETKFALQDIYFDQSDGDIDNKDFLTLIGKSGEGFIQIHSHNLFPPKCQALINKFKQEIEQRSSCWPLHFKQVDIFVDRDNTKPDSEPPKSLKIYDHFQILKDRKLSIVNYEDNSPMIYESILDYKIGENYVEFKFPGQLKIIKLWVSVRPVCLSEITNRINDELGCPEDDDNNFYMTKDKQFYHLAINSLPDHQLKFSWSENKAQFNKLTIKQNIIKDDFGNLELNTLILSSHRCSNKFQKLLIPDKLKKN
jgi:hypothetical protein